MTHGQPHIELNNVAYGQSISLQAKILDGHKTALSRQES